jgi:hypothetical protein
MRWKERPKREWKRWFCILPLKVEGIWVWLEWIEWKDHCLFWESRQPDTPRHLGPDRRK